MQSQVRLRGSHRIYAGAVLKPRGLDGYLDLARPIQSPRFRWVTAYTRRLRVHQFRITEPSAFDDELVGWIGESFDVGEGRHLQRPNLIAWKRSPTTEVSFVAWSAYPSSQCLTYRPAQVHPKFIHQPMKSR